MNMFSVNNELLLQVKKIPLKFLRTAIYWFTEPMGENLNLSKHALRNYHEAPCAKLKHKTYKKVSQNNK